jgi:hypothetical protein
VGSALTCCLVGGCTGGEPKLFGKRLVNTKQAKQCGGSHSANGTKRCRQILSLCKKVGSTVAKTDVLAIHRWGSRTKRAEDYMLTDETITTLSNEQGEQGA